MQLRGEAVPMNINEQIIRPLLMNVSVIFLFLIPLITMRLFAEEKRSGTIELLATSPVRDIEIILGKWLAALILYALPAGIHSTELCISLYLRQARLETAGSRLSRPAAARRSAARNRHVYFDAHRNQIVAGGATFGICLLLWVFEWVSGYDSATWATVLSYLSVITHFESFSRGVIATKDLIFYLTGIYLGLFATARSLESLRWRS